MPTVGGVYVPDELMPRMPTPAAERPSLGSIIGASAEGTWKQVKAALPYQLEVLTREKVDPGLEQQYQRDLADARAAFARAPAAGLDDVGSGRVGVGRFIAENLASSLPQMAGVIAGGVGGGVVGGPGGALAGATAVGTPLFAASNVARAVEENGTLDVAAAERAAAAAPVQAAADALVGRFLPGAGKVLGSAAATQSGNFLRRTAMSIAEAGATEAVTEASQQLLERGAAGIPLGDADAVGEYVNAAVTAFAVGGALGAGGGFRRTNAVAKPVDMVTPEDMLEHINGVLSGTARVTSTEEQLGLPLEGGTATEQQMSLPMAQPTDVGEIQPSQLPQLALDPALSAVPLDTQLELGQRFRDNITPADLPLDGGAVVTPETEAAIRAAIPLREPGLLDTTTLSRGPIEPATPAVEVALPESFRPLQSATGEELETLLRTKGAAPEVVAEASREYAARAAEAAGQSPLTTDDFQTRLDEMKRGLRGGFVQGLEAANPTELTDKVYDQVFTNSDTRSNTVRFAQRLGLLDENLKPGPLAAEVEARRAAARAEPVMEPSAQEDAAPAPTVAVPTAPSAADTAAVADAKKAIGVQREGALKGITTPADVIAELGNEDAFKAKWQGDATRVEQLAKTLGLVTNDDAMDFTPKGRRVFLQSPQGLEATVSAAADNGFVGAAASQFDRGVRDHLNEQDQTTFTNFDEMAAYTAGKMWAQDFVARGEVRSGAQTAAELARQEEAKKGYRQAVGRKSIAPAERTGVERAPLTPDQLRQQSLNQLIDSADLSSVRDVDVAALFRMVREGATPAEVGAALQQVQGGQTLFLQPEATPAELTPARPVRGQPRFREMGGPDSTPSKAAQRAETSRAIKRKAFRDEIDAAYASGDITAKERLTLLFKLAQEDFKGVAARLPGGVLRNDMNVSRRGFLAGVAASAVNAQLDAAQAKVAPVTRTDPGKELIALLKAGNLPAALEHIANHSTVAGYRPIARKLAAAKGWENVKLTAIDAPDDTLYGTTTLNDDGSTAIELYGENGLAEETVLHEALHAYVQQRWASLSVYNERNERLLNAEADRQDKVVRDFVSLWNDVGNALKRTDPALLESKDAADAWAWNFYGSPDEALAWLMTNKQAQAYLKSIDVTGEKLTETLWDRFAGWIADLLGMRGNGVRSALDELLDAGHAIIDAGKDVRAGEFAEIFAAGLARQNGRMELRVSADNRSVEATGEVLKNFAAVSDKVLSTITPDDFGQKARRTMMRWLTHNQLNRMFGNVMPGLLKHTDAHRWRDAVRGNFEAMGDEVYQAFERLERENRNAAEWVGQLMATSTEFQVDPDKAFEEHTHLGWTKDENGKYVLPESKKAEAARIKPMYDAAVKLKNDLSRGNGDGIKVFNQFRAFNEAQNYARLAAGLHNLVAMDPELVQGVQGSLSNPTEAFLQQEGLLSGAAVRDWWHKTLLQQIAATTDFVNTKKGEVVDGNASEQRALRQHLSPIEMQISAIHEAMAGMQKAPYFHLGRFGDYFASAKVRTNADGTDNPAAMQKVADALAKAGFDDVQISEANNRPKIVMRFDTADQTNRFKALMRELHTEGLLEGELNDAVKAGARSRENNYGQTDGFPAFVQNYIEAIEASPLYTPEPGATADEKAALEKRKDEAVRLALDTWLEAQPDNSISKVLAKRYTVPGYKKDMIRNYAHRWRVGSISLANVASAPKFAEAFVDMRSAVEEAKAGGSDADQYLLNDLLAEMKERDTAVPLDDTADTFDKARAIAHSYFLGMSPAYAMINMTQLGVVALPELAKKHGYSKSFHAMRRATGDAMKILKAAFAEARQLGWENWANVAITEDMLNKAGLAPEVARFALRMVASGTIDIGSQARALGQVSENRVGSKLDMGLKYASALGMYSESFSRLTTALAANELHKGDLDSAAKYATDVVSNSMFDYQSWNTARAMGKKGILGPVTPIVTQFMSYSVQMTEKLLSEFHSALARPRKGETAEQTAQRAKESRTFLFGHLTAITAFAGTLGLPFLTVFATVLERMVDQFDDDDDPFDITAAYRNFLADVLGKDVAEVVARGLPRAVGFDISARAGEQNLLPFSEFFADRRPWKEAIEANAGRSLGAVPSMISNIITGGGKIADGDVMGGMKDVMPVAFKGPIEVYRMTDKGYVDGQGNKLPMSPGASAMVWQLLGFTPAQKAEYTEIRGDLQSRKGEISRRAGAIRDGIVDALLSRDTAKANQLLAEAQEFDKDNPSVGLVNSVPAALQRRVMGQARASALSTPLGVSMNDIAGQKMANYANVTYGN